MDKLVRRIFGSVGGPMEPGPFQVFVLEVLRRHFPAESWVPSAQPEVIFCGTDWRFGLQNLYAEYRRLSLVGKDFEEAVIAHFRRTLRNARTKPADPEWSAVQAALRLQLVPAEYAEQAPILTFPFHRDVVVTVVIDQPEGYAVVRAEDVSRWGIPAEDLHARASDNLNAASANVQAQFVPGPNRCIGVQEMDGYDAARLLVPQFRQFLAGHISLPFFAATPNRDFLIAWAADCEPAFHEFARTQVVKGFGERPYPLTTEVFRADDNGVWSWTM